MGERIRKVPTTLSLSRKIQNTSLKSHCLSCKRHPPPANLLDDKTVKDSIMSILPDHRHAQMSRSSQRSIGDASHPSLLQLFPSSRLRCPLRTHIDINLLLTADVRKTMMTDALPPLDTSMPISNLRPLDFSTLLNYNEPFPCSPQANWAAVLSPLRSATRSSPTVLDSALSANPFPSGSPYFGSFSPLYGTPRGLKAWGTSIQNSDVFTAESKPIDGDNLITHQEMVIGEPIQHPQLEEQLFLPKTQSEPIAVPALQPDLLRASSEVTTESIGNNSAATVSAASKPAPKLEKKLSKRSTSTMSSIDKAAERRRKNRESSSRCYYNRKRIIETLDKQISEEKSKLTLLYDKALELRHENARLKKDVVTNGIALPTKSRGSCPTSGSSAFQLRGYLQLLQSAQFYSKK